MLNRVPIAETHNLQEMFLFIWLISLSNTGLLFLFVFCFFGGAGGAQKEVKHLLVHVGYSDTGPTEHHAGTRRSFI